MKKIFHLLSCFYQLEKIRYMELLLNKGEKKTMINFKIINKLS